MRALLAALFLFSVCEASFADTLVLKSGENKKGKIVEEREKSILFNSQADGAVLEFPRSDISIVDRDPADSDKKDFLSVFSTPPPSKKKKFHSLAIAPAEKTASKKTDDPSASPLFIKKETFDQAGTLQAFVQKLQEWVLSHPEAQKYLQEWIEKFHGKDEELDKLAKAANGG